MNIQQLGLQIENEDNINYNQENIIRDEYGWKKDL
jgi:hypothetical protein